MTCVEHKVIRLASQFTKEVEGPKTIFDEPALIEDDRPRDTRIALDQVGGHPSQEQVNPDAGPGLVNGVEKRQEKYQVADPVIGPNDEDAGRRIAGTDRLESSPGRQREWGKEKSLAKLFPGTGHAVIVSPDPNDLR